MKTYLMIPRNLPALLLISAVLSIGWAVLADESALRPAAAGTQPQEILNNAAIIELKGLGLGENLIVDKINASKCDFDVSLAGLKQLKAASVPDAVIKAMLVTKSGGTPTGTVVAGQTADPDDPSSAHEAGIWLCEQKSDKAKMTKLEPSVYSQAKTGVGLFMQFGQTVKSKAVIRSAHAETETTNRRPVFYFYFEKTESGLSDTRNAATSPNEFILSEFEVAVKDNQRSLVMGEMNAYSGGRSGAEGKSVRSITFEKLAPGIYRVSPKDELANGEYGFFYGGNSTMGAYGAGTSGGKVFDFSVRGNSETEPKAVAATGKKKSRSKAN